MPTQKTLQRCLILSAGDVVKAAALLENFAVENRKIDYQQVYQIRDGPEGTLDKVTDGKKFYVLKRFKKSADKNIKEIYFTVKASDLGVGPHVYDYGVSDGTYFIVTDFLEKTLKDLVEEGGLTADVVQQVAKQQKKLLDNNIRHADWHSENVMLDANNNVFVIDYGYSLEEKPHDPMATLGEDFYDVFQDFSFDKNWDVPSYSDAVREAMLAVPEMKPFY